MILDTTFVLDVLRGDAGAVRKARTLQEDILVTAPSVYELYVGIHLARRPSREALRVGEVLLGIPTLPLDDRAAREAGQIYAEKVRGGALIDPEDAMIAGIARVRGERLVTRNVRHFQGIEGVRLESY